MTIGSDEPVRKKKENAAVLSASEIGRGAGRMARSAIAMPFHY